MTIPRQVGYRPIDRLDGYLPIEDHGLIGDGATAALVGRDGAVSWLCVPRFDARPLFCSLLDRRRGGAFTVQPEGLRESRQRYVGDSGVLLTEMNGPEGAVAVTDALTLRAGADLTEDVPAARGELVRRVRATAGRARVVVAIEPYGGARVEPFGGGLRLSCLRQPDLVLNAQATRKLDGLRTVIDLEEGDGVDLALRWGHRPSRHQRADADEILGATVDAWTRWVRHVSYDGPQGDLVRRSAVTLKLLDHFPNGAIVAAPTSSLPETIGGVRNWDYRYAWVRDCAFSVYALRRIGLSHEARAFLGWALDAAERHNGPKVMYSIDGEVCPQEREDDALEGYRASSPVRWGNGAAFQSQNDVYGELLDCAYQWARGGEEVDADLWRSLRTLVEWAGAVWDEPDHGIWEVRTDGRIFTYSAALCHVALDRGAALAEAHGLDGDIPGWRETADRIR
jgi:alpha,alpha-trehalase